MVIDSTKTTVAYRCPSCGAGVMSVVGLFNLNADMVKLKCDCGESAMTLVYGKGKDSKVRLTVPCVLCPNPHNYTVSSSIFFKNDLFILPCPYSDLTVAATGETNAVKAELSRSELELLDLLEKSGVSSLDSLHQKSEATANIEAVEIISYMLKELDEEGKIECDCSNGCGKDFELSFYDASAEIACKCCGCKKIIPTDSIIEANMLLSADKLSLRPKS